MKVTFISNYINHHQIPLSDELYQIWGEDYTFIQTEPMEEERIKMGWVESGTEIPYVKVYDSDPEGIQKLIDTCDIAIFDGLDDESYIAKRLNEKKIVLRTWERLYKTGQWKAVSPRGLIKKHHDHTRYSKDRVYLLCYGGYVADDFEIIKAYRGKRLKWGYFPEFHEFERATRKAKKEKEIPMVLWAGRMIPWKHGMDALKAVKSCIEEGLKFRFVMVGNGECEEELKNYVSANHLEETVTFTGALSPKEVREQMEKADVYLFTSDYEEGWGVVANESMNSGCVLIASHAAGAVPFLVRDNENGLIYESGNVGQLSECLSRVLKDESFRERLQDNAYETIKNMWNAHIAAKRLVKFCEELQNGTISFEEEGPLSEAYVIPEKKMYRYLKGEWKCP